MGYVDLRRRHEERARHRREHRGFWDDAADGRHLLTPIAAVVLLVAGFGIGLPSLLASLSPPGFAGFFIVAAPLIPAAACIWGGSKLWLSWSRESAPRTPGKSGAEKQLLLALRESAGLTAVGAALETSLTVDEAEELLTRLADRGHLVIEGRDGALFYAFPGRRPTPGTHTV